MRFLDLELEEAVPMATTIWLFREALAKAGLIDQLFARFGQHLEAGGYIARGGQIIDTTIVSVPKQRNTKEENEAIKAARRRRDGRTSRPRMPRRTGRALDEEERRKLLRLQEPCRRGQGAQADPQTPARRSGRTAPTARYRSRWA
jgi:IS5 family transposase